MVYLVSYLIIAILIFTLLIFNWYYQWIQTWLFIPYDTDSFVKNTLGSLLMSLIWPYTIVIYGLCIIFIYTEKFIKKVNDSEYRRREKIRNKHKMNTTS